MAKKTYLTLPQVAKRVKLHRTTLLRMEQRGVIPPAKWSSRPIRARIYSEEDVVAIQTALDTYFAQREAGELVVDDADVVEPEAAAE
jgi:DNA-binding transcriptional MerR regulator